MNMIGTIKNLLQKKKPVITEKPVVEAYDIWSASYDAQPGNLMLDLDEKIFSNLLQNIDLENKQVADIGCGTGRHWQKIYEKQPALLTGYDVSGGMLKQLSIKFPSAITRQITDNLLKGLPAKSMDCIISTLTIAHIQNIEEAIASWSRILKAGGDLVVTDFHPAILAQGGKRSFKTGKQTLSVINYIHPLDELLRTFDKYGLNFIRLEEEFINDDVRSYYENQHAMKVFERFKGMPVIFGLHLKKQHGPE
jgi:ubiquinone/menaquinone biosynthesis C-methylase UbiE